MAGLATLGTILLVIFSVDSSASTSSLSVVVLFFWCCSDFLVVIWIFVGGGVVLVVLCRCADDFSLFGSGRAGGGVGGCVGVGPLDGIKLREKRGKKFKTRFTM